MRFLPPSAEFWSLWQKHCHSAVCSERECSACVQLRAVVAGSDRETGLVFAGPVSGGSESGIPSVTRQSVVLPIEQLYFSAQIALCLSKLTFVSRDKARAHQQRDSG